MRPVASPSARRLWARLAAGAGPRAAPRPAPGGRRPAVARRLAAASPGGGPAASPVGGGSAVGGGTPAEEWAGGAGAGHALGRVPSSPSSSGPSSSSACPGGHGGRRPPKVLVQPLPAFWDDRFPGPEPHVAAFLLGSTIDLRELRGRFVKLDCPTVMWQGQVLFVGSSEQLAQQQCSAVFLPDGCVVCWHMSRATEHRVLALAAECPSRRRRPARFGRADGPAPAGAAAHGVPLAEERLDVADAEPGATTVVHAQDGSVSLARDPLARASHQLGVSLGLAVAVRLDALERQIEVQLDDNWREMNRKVKHSLNLSEFSHRIFVMETGLHDLRYELNSEAGLVDAPDLLWEHALAERLYEKVVAHHDTHRRTTLLNERLSFSLDYLNTLSEHVRHEYSSRLEKIIIVLIFFELCVGMASHAPRRDGFEWGSGQRGAA